MRWGSFLCVLGNADEMGVLYNMQSCNASHLPDLTRKSVSEKETDRSFGLRNSRYLDSIEEAAERELSGVVSCANILVPPVREGIISLGRPFIPIKTGSRDGRKS